jgi:hypothetical protein
VEDFVSITSEGEIAGMSDTSVTQIYQMKWKNGESRYRRCGFTSVSLSGKCVDRALADLTKTARRADLKKFD